MEGWTLRSRLAEAVCASEMVLEGVESGRTSGFRHFLRLTGSGADFSERKRGPMWLEIDADAALPGWFQ